MVRKFVNASCALALTAVLGVSPVAHAQFTNPPAFAPPSTGSVGDGPFNLALIDVNLDGKLDVVTPDYFTDSVTVLMNATAPDAGAISLSGINTFGAGDGPFSVIGVDLDLDGRPDIVTSNELSDSVSVLRNLTTPGASVPSFAAAQAFAVGDGPLSVAAADIDSDGRPDLVMANFNANTISVLVNNTALGSSSISFHAAVSFSVGQGPFSVALADLNLDGKPDLVTANFSDGTVTVRINTTDPGAGAPSFGAAAPFSAGSGCRLQSGWQARHRGGEFQHRYGECSCQPDLARIQRGEFFPGRGRDGRRWPVLGGYAGRRSGR